MREHKTVLITGASQGLGHEFAKIFANENYDLVLVARDKEKLQEVARDLKRDAIFIKIIDEDLSENEAPQRIYDLLKKDDITIEVLVNNAGSATYGEFVNLPTQNEIDEINVNVTSLTHLTSLFIKDMVPRGSGRILNIASTAAFQPGPLMAVYYATKAYVLHFSEAIAEEARGTGVTVTVLCPGPTSTGFQKSAGMEHVRLFTRSVMKARDVAEEGYKGLMEGKVIVIPGFKNKIMTNAYRFIPRSVAARITKRLQQKV